MESIGKLWKAFGLDSSPLNRAGPALGRAGPALGRAGPRAEQLQGMLIGQAGGLPFGPLKDPLKDPLKHP